MRQEFNFLGIRLEAMFGVNRTLHIITNTQSPIGEHGGGSITEWGWISAAALGRLVNVEGKMNAVEYGEILEENLMQCVRGLRLGRFFFQAKQWHQANRPTVNTEGFKRIMLLFWTGRVKAQISNQLLFIHDPNLSELADVPSSRET